MKSLQIIIGALLFLAVACQFRQDTGENHYAELIHDKGNTWVRIHSRIWEGLYGVEGFKGYRNISYLAKLDGPGPTFTDPPFWDFPPRTSAIGNITLDLEGRVIVLNMRRVVSGFGPTAQTTAHPGNGRYPITIDREAKPGEMSP